MSDHDGYCACPILRIAAEMERLAGYGMIAEASGYNGPEYLVIAALRDRYGCKGPRGGYCRWYSIAGPGLKLKPRDDVPVVKSNREPGKQTGEYL